MDSLLSQADAISQKYSLEIAKTAPPTFSPNPCQALKRASIWFTLDLSKITAPAFDTLNSKRLWDILSEMGVQGVHLENLKQGGAFRNGIAIDPKWGSGWEEISSLLDKKELVLIGDSFGNATGLSLDFAMSLKNVEGYRGLYHLVEIEKRDWPLLPCTPKGFANVPWLALQTLHKKGYVPEQFAPYVKESSWNATGQIQCVDGKVRRWIYLKENKEDPVINWLGSSFAGCRIATSDLLDSVKNLGQKIIQINGEIERGASEMLTLEVRKVGGFSVLKTNGGLGHWQKAKTDLIIDHLTRPALLHALIAQDAEVLKLMYRLFLEENIPNERLVHILQPYSHFSCDYAIFAENAKKKFQYYEEILTGDALKNRLLKEDAATIAGPDPVTWPSLCQKRVGSSDKALMDVHLLLALFYAMQPGVFSFSVSDLLGLTADEIINPMVPNENSLYGSLPSQMKNSCSFANRLKEILMTRMSCNIESAELFDVPDTNQKGLLILLYRLKGSFMTQMLAVNFSSATVRQTIDLPALSQTSAINLMTGLCEKKALNATAFQLELPPLSGKVILFQSKYLD
jgi:hypothetical protein